MSWFSKDKDDERYGDAALVKAARAQVLRQLRAKGMSPAAASNVVNNHVYGAGGGGVMDHLGTGGATPHDGEDPFSYYVDIMRKDLPDINEKTGKPIGWEKSVHRYKKKRD